MLFHGEGCQRIVNGLSFFCNFWKIRPSGQGTVRPRQLLF
jgi:hypothetical protein